MIGKTGTALAVLMLAMGLIISNPGPARADDILDRGIGSEWSSLDPQINFEAAAGWIQMDTYEGLVSFDPSGKIIPGAAESWEAGEEGRTYTFHLREGLKWSNGDPLVAQDYVNGVLRTLDPATVSEKGYYFSSVLHVKGAKELSEGITSDASVLGFTAPDDRTVVVQMLDPAPHLLDIMGAFATSPLHEPSLEQYGPSVFANPEHVVSNGAYVIKEVVPQSHVLLEANPNYWDAAHVGVKKVKYHVTEDVATELKRYQAGEIDITYDIPLNQIETLKAEISDQVKISPSTEAVYYSFNLTHEALKNKDLRRALSLAIDRDVLEGKIVKGEAIPVMGLAGGFDPTYSAPKIAEATLGQPERETLAKELYAAAGYGPDNPLKVNIVTTVAESDTRRAQGVALMWKKVLGVEAAVEPQERKAWLDTFYAGSWDVFADDLVGDFAGAETFLAYMVPSAEAGYNWHSDAYESAMAKAGAIADKPARNAALAEAERILLDDYIFAPLAIIPTRHLVKPNVKGYAESAAGYNNSQFMTLQ